MTIRELLKSRIDSIPEDCLDILRRIMNSLESLGHNSPRKPHLQKDDWLNFIAETYGCLAADPIERGEQGSYEIRNSIK